MRTLAALLLLAGALIIASPPAQATTATAPKPLVLTIVVVKKGVVGGLKRFTVKKGRRVVLVVRSSIADEIHLHGYDISRNVRAGGTARIAFTARLPGIFEVELEDRGLLIARITVRP